MGKSFNQSSFMKYFFNLKYFNLRKLIVIIIFFYPFQVFSQSSSGLKFKNIENTEFIAAYSLTYKLDSLNLDDVRNQEMWLFIGKNISYFVSKYHYLDLQAMSKIKTPAERQLWTANRGPYELRSLYHIYKNYPTGKITFTESSLSGFFKYQENLDAFNWKLTQDTATICGYLSQKATCEYGGRSWIAWFSTEIPFNDGPYKFNGLAGLIVKIYDTRNHYIFELTSIEVADPDLMISILDYAYIETTKENYFRAREDMRNSISSIVKQRGGDNYSQETAARVLASRNNHIELK